MKTKAENQPHTEETLRPVEAAEQAAGSKPTERALEERLRFEELLSNISSRFVNIPPDRVDLEIEESLKQILDFFKVDRCALIRGLLDKGSWQITHVALSEGVPPVPVGVELPTSTHPWVYHKLIEKGEVVSVSNPDDLSAEASIDKQTWIGWGIRSTLSIPILIGEAVGNVITVNSVKSGKIWPQELFPRLRLRRRGVTSESWTYLSCRCSTGGSSCGGT